MLVTTATAATVTNTVAVTVGLGCSNLTDGCNQIRIFIAGTTRCVVGAVGVGH